MMGLQPSKARWAREESPLPRADDEANAYENTAMYEDSEDSDEPSPLWPMPNGLPSLSLDATPTPSIYPNGLPRHPPASVPAAYSSGREESPIPLKGEPEENFELPSQGASRTQASASRNMPAKAEPLTREEEDNDEIIYEQPSAHSSRKKKKDKKNKAEKRKKREQAEKLARSAGDDDDEQLPTPDITDSLVSADDNEAVNHGGEEGDREDYVVSDLMPPPGKSKSKKRKAKETLATLDLEDDPIAETQEIDVPASFQPTRKRKERDDQGTHAGLKTRKKRKVHAPAEPVEDFDEAHIAESAGDEVVENTQENTTPRPLRLNAEFEGLDPNRLAVASKTPPVLLESGSERPEPDPRGSLGTESPLGRSEEASDGDLTKHEPNPHELSSSSSDTSDSVLRREPSPGFAPADDVDQHDSGLGEDAEAEGQSEEEATDESLQSPEVDQIEHGSEGEEASGLAGTTSQEGLELPGDASLVDKSDHLDTSGSETTQPISLTASTKALGPPDEIGEGVISDTRVSSIRREHALRKASPARRKLPFVRTLARRPKATNTKSGTSESVEDAEVDPTEESAGVDYDGIYKLADSLRAATTPAATRSAPRPQLSQTSSRRRPKVPYFEREGQESVTVLAATVTGDSWPAPVDEPASASRPVQQTRNTAALPRTPQPDAAAPSHRPPSISEKAKSSRSRANDSRPASVASGGGPANQGSEQGTQHSPPANRTGPLTQEEEDQIMRAVEAFQVEKGLTTDKTVELIHTNPKYGLLIHRQLWIHIEKACPTRKRQKLIDWCRKKYHHFVGRGVWTQQEDEELRRMVEQHGPKWTVIAKEINRHPNDVRDRYRNYVSCGPNQNKDYWQEDEEERLRDVVLQCLRAIDAVRKMEGDVEDERSNEECLDWTIVSEKMDHTRSRRQCLQKWKQLRSSDDIGSCSAVLSPGASWRLDRARQQLSTLTPHDKFLLVRGIRTSGATKDSKIVWKDVTSSLFDKQYPNATLAVFWGRLKRTVPGWDAKSTVACAEYLCKEHGAEGRIDVDLGDSEADERDEERIIANLTPGAAASPWASKMAPPSSIRSADRDKIHRTPRDMYSDSPRALVGTAPIGRTPKVRAHHVMVSGAPATLHLDSELQSQLSTPTSRAGTAVKRPGKSTIGNGAFETPSKTAANKHSKSTVRGIPANRKVLSAEMIASGDSDSDEVDETPRRPSSQARNEAPGEKRYKGRHDALASFEIADQDDVDHQEGSARARRAPSEGTESIDLGTDLGQPGDSRDHLVGDDSALLPAPTGQLNPKAPVKAKGKKLSRTTPAGNSKAPSGQKRRRADEESDVDLDDFQPKRSRRDASPAKAVAKEPTDESDESSDEEVSQREAESHGSSVDEIETESVRDTGRHKATESQKRDAIRNDSDGSSNESAGDDAVDADEADDSSGVNWGSPMQAAIASSMDNDLSTKSDFDSESNMDDMEDIPARAPETARSRGRNPIIDDEASEEEEEAEESEEEDEEEDEEEESDEEESGEFDGFGDNTLLASNLQSDSDDEDYVDN
ncbi:hypothetical protein GQ53DRAFT_844550 [Thozetella sp. PMI_491]|nr:hypothetical protein GQ53DRAFT_844550 [Thozetella sp. PMI_491]